MITTSTGESYEDEFHHAMDNSNEKIASGTKETPYDDELAKGQGISDQDPAQRQKYQDYMSTINIPESVPTKIEDEKPKPKTLYIIRHGSTDMNDESNTSTDRIRGWTDVPLNDEGRQDAHKAGQKLASMDQPTVMHHSDLDRASETADIISKYVPVTSKPSRKLRPWDLGVLTGQSTKEAIPQIEDYVQNKPDEPVPKGESFNEFKDRAFRGIHDALNSGDSPVAIVTHHRLERLLEAWDAKGQPEDHSIDLDTFTQKGDPPGGVKELQIMTHQPEDPSWAQAKRNVDTTAKFVRDRVMFGPDLMKKFVEGDVLPENAGPEGIKAAWDMATSFMPIGAIRTGAKAAAEVGAKKAMTMIEGIGKKGNVTPMRNPANQNLTKKQQAEEFEKNIPADWKDFDTTAMKVEEWEALAERSKVAERLDRTLTRIDKDLSEGKTFKGDLRRMEYNKDKFPEHYSRYKAILKKYNVKPLLPQK